MLMMGDGRPDNSPGDMSALMKAYKEARAAKQASAPPPAPPGPPPPSVPISVSNYSPPSQVQPTQAMPPAQGLDLPMAPSVPMPQPRPQMAAPTPAPAPVPVPQPRPAEAPQPMGFFARNTAMMRDPLTGAFLDPASAKQADATGPDVIQKFMNYFHNKA